MNTQHKNKKASVAPESDAMITAGGFHHVDCPCDGCETLRNKAQGKPELPQYSPLAEAIDERQDRAEAVEAFNLLHAEWEKTRNQRDNYKAQAEALAEALRDALASGDACRLPITKQLNAWREALAAYEKEVR